MATLSARGAQTVLVFLIIRMNINKAIHWHVGRLCVAALGFSTSQNNAILCGLCMLFLVANKHNTLARSIVYNGASIQRQ